MTPLLVAKDYAELEWHVFPCVPGGKRPAIERGCHAACVDPCQIDRWWADMPEANIGITAGPSGLVVIDLDRKGDVDGLRTLGALEDAIGVLPPTLTVSTPSGGEHRYFGAPEGIDLRPSAGKIGGRAAPGVDVRAGWSYVVAPPSSVDGRPYRWIRREPVAPLPGAWTDALLAVEGTARPPASRTRMDVGERARRYAVAALINEGRATRDAPKGQRNAQLFKSAAAIARFVGRELSRHEVEDMLIQAARESGLIRDDGERSVLATMESGFRSGGAR